MTAEIVHPGFEPVREELMRMVEADPHYSAQFCAYADGVPVVDIWGGSEIDGESIQGVFSATKGISAISLALLLERGALDLEAPVTRYWPAFAQAGKADITVRVALSHQAGLIGIDDPLTFERLTDHDAFAGALAAQSPFWQPGAAHGYHALTIGTMIDELVRRIDGRSVADFYAQEIATPLGIDFFITTPDAQEDRVVDVLPAKTVTGTDAATEAIDDERSLMAVAFSGSGWDPFDPPLPNRRAVRAAGLAAVGGVGSARGLARAYAACVSEVDETSRILSPATVAEMSRLQTTGSDLVLGFPTRFAIVFQVPDERLAYGSWRAFGHDGAGGAIGVADPEYGLAYGYIPRRMSTPGGADPRGLALARTLRRCVEAGRR
ncbi:serine hydrolase domain-containing protein [Microbacterium sp. 2FI]|uniref:serine hydrolase domain-containing protein n=1 Tax=Microbacterium sp. 2FI TaxID=2502193 RepID=UPI0010F904A4|nr:serine hydrolase domain-containing protein [Microbacterium sp. 2FI]